jgi:hypothetical protein
MNLKIQPLAVTLQRLTVKAAGKDLTQEASIIQEITLREYKVKDLRQM